MARRSRQSWIGALALLCSGPLVAEPPVVFVSRYMDSDPDASVRAAAIERALSGRLMLREEDGSVRALVDGTLPEAGDEVPVDITDPDVSFDATRIVLAGYSRVEEAWRIFEIGADGAGLRQITRSDRDLDLSRFGGAAEVLEGYDDVDPCYLPDGRICFVSTRYPQVAPDGRRRATNLYRVNPDGSDVHRITTERFGADTPVVDPTSGKIVYSRWWRSTIFNNGTTRPGGENDDDLVPPGSPGYGGLPPPATTANPVPALRGVPDGEFPGLNSWFLADINPDGTAMAMLSGVGLDRTATQAHRPAMTPEGDAIALFIPRTPFLGLPRGDGLRLVRPGPVAPTGLGGPQTFGPAREVRFVYASAEVLDDRNLLVTATRVPAAADPGAGRSSPLDYDLYVQNRADGRLVPLHRAEGSAEMHAVPLLPRRSPPVIEDSYTGRRSDVIPRDLPEAIRSGGTFTFRVENIFLNAPVDDPTATAPPMGQGLSIQFWTNFQRTGRDTPDEPILVHQQRIPPGGRVEAVLPAGVPLFEVLRTPEGEIAMGRDGQIFHVGGLNFGTEASREDSGSCVGCHAGHSMQEVPRGDEVTWTNVAPSAAIRASSVRNLPGLDGQRDVQRFLRAENLVDRRTDAVDAEWASAADSPTISMGWTVELEGRELVIYGPRGGEGRVGPRTQVIDQVVVTTRLRGRERQRLTIQRPIEPQGTVIALNAEATFDRIDLEIPVAGVSGVYEGRPFPALAEVEVVAREAGASRHPSWSRGDTNCDGDHNLTDGVLLLGHLFAGVGEPCCEVAADTDGDEVVRVTDAIFLLDFLFRGGARPPAPFPDCAPAASGDLSCRASICP